MQGSVSSSLMKDEGKIYVLENIRKTIFYKEDLFLLEEDALLFIEQEDLRPLQEEDFLVAALLLPEEDPLFVKKTSAVDDLEIIRKQPRKGEGSGGSLIAGWRSCEEGGGGWVVQTLPTLKL